MEPNVQRWLDLFVRNTQTMREQFPWRNATHKRLAALLFAAEEKSVDAEGIRDGLRLIKGSAGLFSAFRGNSAMAVATLLALHGDPAALLHDSLVVYERMKQAGFRASDYLVVAAHQIAARAPQERWDETIARAKTFYDGLKRGHRFLTGQDDYIFAAALGLSGMEAQAGLERMERLFQTLRPEFHAGNGVQALVQVLALGGGADGIEGRVLALRDALQERGVRLDGQYTLSSLGVLALLPSEIGPLAEQIVETCGWLRGQSGFGVFRVTRQELWLLSAALVAIASTDGVEQSLLRSTLITSITHLVMAQQTAAAAAASSSAGS